MYGLIYFVDGSVIASVIQDAYRNVGITVTCKEDPQPKHGWIEVILPAEQVRVPEGRASLVSDGFNYLNIFWYI